MFPKQATRYSPLQGQPMGHEEPVNYTQDFISAGLKLTERDTLRQKFIKPLAPPPGSAMPLTAKDNFLADVLADPHLAEACRPYFTTDPVPLDPTIFPGTPEMLPWGYRPQKPASDNPFAEVSDPEVDTVWDFVARTTALMAGVAVSGVAPLSSPYIYEQTLDGRPIKSTPGPDFQVNQEMVGIPRQADRVLVLGFVRSPKIMGLNPKLGGIIPSGPWLDLPQQITATHNIADFISNLGYLALPSAGGLVLADHLGVLAGLGELGRQGLLITPEYGPNLRLMTIITDFPFELDSPMGFGVADYCETCQKCITECPAQALTPGRRSPGLYQWPVNRGACFDNWLQKGDPCQKCIEICPYTREPLVGT